jgi:hypothetical protein
MTHRSVLVVFSGGLVLGGLLTSFGLWAFSVLLPDMPVLLAFALVCGIAFLAIGHDTQRVDVAFPQCHRQVPTTIFQRSPRSAALQFGFEMGTGVRTYLSAATPFVVAALLLVSAPALYSALATGAGFGVGRASTAAARALSGGRQQWDVLLARSLGAIRVSGSFMVAASSAFLLM